jgi:hypothetical protein
MKDYITLVKESYREAKKGLDSKMELIGMVVGFNGDGGALTKKAIYDIDNQLREEAKKVGATHVFGVEYLGTVNSIGYGDAYKPVEKLADEKPPYNCMADMGD